MKRTICRSWPLLFLLLATCTPEQKNADKLFNFEALIDDQISQLSQRMRVLDKEAELGGQRSDSTFLPTAKGWGDELDVFRQLDVMNRPANRDAYKVEDPLRDTRSNLRIRRYVSATSAVPEVKIYYHNDLAGLKKIEASVRESNLLFTTSRTLTMEFEEDDNHPLLTGYSIVGFQKVPFTDTVRFSISGRIDW